jgi:hypothetical protein
VALFQCYFVNQKIDRAYFVPVNGDFPSVTSYILDIKDKIVDFPEPVFLKWLESLLFYGKRNVL